MRAFEQAHSLSSRGKTRARSSASSSSSSTLTASSSDVSIKRYVKDSLNNNHSDTEVQSNEESLASTTTHPGLYKEPRLNKSDSASLSQHQWLNGRLGSHVPLSPNSIDNRYILQYYQGLETLANIYVILLLGRLRAIQISISHDQLNNRTASYNHLDMPSDDLLTTQTGHHNPALGNTLTPIVQQPTRRVSLGRESFRQRNIAGCVPQNLVFRGDQQHQSPNLNIDNCFVLKSQLRR